MRNQISLFRNVSSRLAPASSNFRALKQRRPPHSLGSHTAPIISEIIPHCLIAHIIVFFPNPQLNFVSQIMTIIFVFSQPSLLARSLENESFPKQFISISFLIFLAAIVFESFSLLQIAIHNQTPTHLVNTTTGDDCLACSLSAVHSRASCRTPPCVTGMSYVALLSHHTALVRATYHMPLY